jgi:hypothetical protein
MEELLKKEQELIRINAEIDEKNRKLREDDKNMHHSQQFLCCLLAPLFCKVEGKINPRILSPKICNHVFMHPCMLLQKVMLTKPDTTS